MVSDIKSARVDHRAFVAIAAYYDHFMWCFYGWLRRGGLLLCYLARDNISCIVHGRRSDWITLFYTSLRRKSAVKVGAIRRQLLTTSLGELNLLLLLLVHAGGRECHCILGESGQAKLIYLRVCIIHVFLISLHGPILTIWHRHLWLFFLSYFNI